MCCLHSLLFKLFNVWLLLLLMMMMMMMM